MSSDLRNHLIVSPWCYRFPDRGLSWSCPYSFILISWLVFGLYLQSCCLLVTHLVDLSPFCFPICHRAHLSSSVARFICCSIILGDNILFFADTILKGFDICAFFCVVVFFLRLRCNPLCTSQYIRNLQLDADNWSWFYDIWKHLPRRFSV